MGAYAATVSTPLNRCERISRSLGMFAGKVNVTNYNTTIAEITGITKYFVTGGVSGFTQGLIAVVPQGASDNGHIMQWDYNTGAFKCYKPTAAVTPTGTVTQPTFAGSAAVPTLAVIDSTLGVNVELIAGQLAATAAATSLSVDTYTPAGVVSQPTFAGVASSAAAATEAAIDDDCGQVGFIAIGFI